MADETKEELTGRDTVVEEEDEDRPWCAVSVTVFQEPPEAGVAGSPRRFTDMQQAHAQAKLKRDTPDSFNSQALTISIQQGTTYSFISARYTKETR